MMNCLTIALQHYNVATIFFFWPSFGISFSCKNMYKWGVWLVFSSSWCHLRFRCWAVTVLSLEALNVSSNPLLSLSRVFGSNCTWKSWMCISRRCLICSLYQKVAGQRNSGEKFHVSVLIMHKPFLQLHTWLISFSLLNSFPVTFTPLPRSGEKVSAVLIVSNLGSSFEARE